MPTFSQNDSLFMQTAILFAKRSKCISKQVGCIVVKNSSIISSGINGTPKGFINCCEAHKNGEFKTEEHHDWSNIHELHAELNAITRAHENNINIQGSTFYVTLQPCFSCMKMLVSMKVNRIVYATPYDRSNGESIAFARNQGVIVDHFYGLL